MKPLLFVPYYFHWHYFEAPKQIIGITKNLIWFMAHFFSLSLLLRTLFSPFMRLQEEKPKHFSVSEFFGTLLVNTIVRAVGAVVRLLFIFCGLVSIAVLVVASIIFLGLWMIFPFVLLFLFIMGVTFIIKSA